MKRSILAYLMLCGLLVFTSTIQAATPAQSSDEKASDTSAAHQALVAAAASLPPGQLLIPANGNCLYTTIIMGYLLPVRQDRGKVHTRMAQLFGHPLAYYLNRLDQTLQNPTHYLIYLHSKEFTFLVNTFMTRMHIAKGTWGGPQEIQTIATKLHVNIQAYYPDPSSPMQLVQSDLTPPSQANTDVTLHIVRDRVHPAEVLTQAEKVSAEDNPHYQHYRLKYTLSHGTASSLHLDDDIVDSTNSKQESTAKAAAPKTTAPRSPSAAHVDTDTAIHSLTQLLEDNPHQIVWQGWVDMAAYGDKLKKTYVIVTIAGLLYTLQDRPLLSPQSQSPITRTINLADYGFVLNIDVHKPHSFVLAKVNPANTTLTASNAFALDNPTADSLADGCISYVGQSDVEETRTSALSYALRTIPHHYVYIDANKKAIYSLYSDTTFVAGKEKAQQEAATTAKDTPQRPRALNARHRRPMRSRSGGASPTASTPPHELGLDTLHYHLVPLSYQIAGDHTATTTCYCLVPPSYTITYQSLVKLLTHYQGMAVQQLTYLPSGNDLQDSGDNIDWAIAKRKGFQVYFDLAPHFLQSPARILWQGWACLAPYGATGQQSYCLITDDDKLYLFGAQPDVARPARAKAQHTIDLASYSFVHSHPDNPNSLILSQINPACQPPTADNTFTCYTAKPKLPPTAAEEKVHPTPPTPLHNDTLLRTLRQATHLYHYMEQPMDKQPRLRAFDQAASLDTNAYRLVQISCQTQADKPATKCYCLLPLDYQPTYAAFAQLWQAYFHTKQLQLTHHAQNIPLETSQNAIHWDTKANKAFRITLPARLPAAALCRLGKAGDPAKPALERGKAAQAAPQKPLPPPSKKKNAQEDRKRSEDTSVAPQQAADLFAYQAKFAKMNRLDLWALDPLQQLQDPRLLLKKLLAEVIQNECEEDLPGSDFLQIKQVKYVTPKECPWLAKVAAKIDHDTHYALGQPLNIAEMAAIKLYTDSKYAYLDLGWAQRSGNLSRWQVWDQLLLTAMLKLHLAELSLANEDNHWKQRMHTYSGLADIQFAVEEKIGFFKTYVSTSTSIHKALTFTKGAGMLMCVSPAMQQEFINCNVDWISKFPENEILFARSVDMAGFPAPKWKGEVKGDRMSALQKVIFSPAAAPLIIPKGTTYTLPAQAGPYEFSYIKIEEEATLTIVPWQLNPQSGGHLTIRCYGDCILSKNAKISVSAKGYAGSTSPHYHGHGPRGGASGIYCAAGGSNSTAGGSGQCRDAFSEATTYHASSTVGYGQVILTKDPLLTCGSGGGYVRYPNSGAHSLSPGANGASGGGALYIELDSDLQLAENTAFLANGGEATPLTGGAGSGGSICLALKGEVIFTSPTAQLYASAQGGNNHKALHPSAQGAGGAGHITLYMNPQNQHALKRVMTQPPALVLLTTQVAQRKIYRDDLVDHYLMAQGISSATVKHFWEWLEAEAIEEDAIMEDMQAATPSQSNIYQFDQAIFHALQDLMRTLVPQQLPNRSAAPPVPPAPTPIPDHVTIASKYYNAQGIAHAAKADYPQAILYHQAALALQTKQYGDTPHPDKADTLLCLAKVAAHQGHYAQAMEAGKAALDIRQQLYQAAAPAHRAIIEARNQLAWLDYQQGQTIQALQQLEETLQLWQQHHPEEKEPVLIDTYNYMGLVQQSLGQYQKAIDKYHSEAQAMAQSGAGAHHGLRATTLHYIGQAHVQLGQYGRAIATHHEEMRLLAELHGQDTPHPDKARSLRGEALAYLKQGNAAVAMQKYRAALAQLQKTYGQKATHPDMAAALSGIAHAHAAQGNYPLATLFHKKSQAMLQAIYGREEDHPALANTLEDLGDLALQQQATGQAMQHY